MYFIAVIGVIVSFLLGVVFFGGFGMGIMGLIDPTSFILLLILCIPVLMAAGVLKDFVNGFRFAVTKKQPQSLGEIKRAIQAVELAIRTLLFGSLFLSVMPAILVLYEGNGEYIWPSIGVSAICFAYGLGMIILLLPVKTRLEFKLIDFINSEE